jgi:hypothetical protein
LEQTLVALALCICAPEVRAEASYNSNPYSPYPPSCLTKPLYDVALAGPGVALFYRETISLELVSKLQDVPPSENRGDVELSLYRVACAEPNRSVIVAEFRLPTEWVEPRRSVLILPLVRGVTGFDYAQFELNSEPGRWGESVQQHSHTTKSIGDYTGGWYDARNFVWRYVLDTNPMAAWGGRAFITRYYNDRFSLTFFDNGGRNIFTVDVPSTSELLTPRTSLPLSGRLSGNWIEARATDQGLLISVSPIVPTAGSSEEFPDQSDLLLFLSWYTFDHQGQLLWLTGTARIEQGASEAVLTIQRVRNGRFMSGQRAERAVVGHAVLKAISCNHLELEFELDGVGLGAGLARLQRLSSLEIADHPCRDYLALKAGMWPLPDNQTSNSRH